MSLNEIALPRIRRFCRAWHKTALLSLGLTTHTARAQSAATALTLGARIERAATREGEADSYSLRLASGAAASVAVRERGVHVVIDVVDPAGHSTATFDEANADTGVKRFTFTALQSGEHRLLVRAAARAAGGTYSLSLAQLLDPMENAKRLAKRFFPSPRLFALWKEASLHDSAAVARFIQERRGKGPLIDSIDGDTANLRVTYLFVGDTNTDQVRVCGGPQCAVNWMPLTRFLQSSLFYASEIVPRDARYRYHFLVTDVHRLGPDGIVRVSADRDVIDSLNPDVADGLSALVLPGAPPEPYINVRRGVPRGSVTPFRLHSRALDADRDVAMYTPPGYDRKTRHRLLIVFDGEAYGADSGNAPVPMPTILDNMIADGRIGSTIAVLVRNVDRTRDLGGYPPFAEFIVSELIPWARAHYSIFAGPSRIVLAGSSRGGHAAAYIAFHHPEAVGNVLSQSGAYWIRSTLDEETDWPFPYAPDHPAFIDEVRNAPRRPIRFYLEVGRFDSAVEMVPLNRELRDLLIAKGYDVTYREFDGGHNYFAWRGSISQGLITLLGR